jgi:hypothetical protein
MDNLEFGLLLYGVLILVLVWIGWNVRRCVVLLIANLREIECLHEDFNVVHDAHERIAHAQEIKMDAEISAHMKDSTQ